MEEQTQPQQVSSQPAPAPSAPAKQISRPLIITTLLVFLLMAGGLVYLGYQNYQLQQKLGELLEQQTSQTQPTPISTSTQYPQTVDQEANWKTYNNTKYSYSLKFPQSFKTQVLAAGAGNLEATPNSDHIFVYNSPSQEPYLERYIEIQPIAQAATYGGEWQRSDVKIGTVNAAKYENQDPNTFIIYRTAIPNTNGELEIYVTKNSQKKDLANQILSTLKFSD